MFKEELKNKNGQNKGNLLQSQFSEIATQLRKCQRKTLDTVERIKLVE